MQTFLKLGTQLKEEIRLIRKTNLIIVVTNRLHDPVTQGYGGLS